MSFSQQVGLIGADQLVWPPDTQIAVNSSYVVEFVNSSSSIWSRSGSLTTWSDLNADFPVDQSYTFSDPRLLFDQLSGRWLASGMAFDAAFNGETFVAVSETSDPTQLWDFYVIASNTSGTLYDQPRLGVSDDVVVLSWDDYVGGATWNGSETWVLQKSDLLNPQIQTISFTAFGPDPTRFAVVPAQSLSDTHTQYLLYNNSDPSLNQNTFLPTLGVVWLTGTPANNNVEWNEADPLMFGTTSPPNAQQPDGGWPVATNDDRLQSAVWQNGFFWTSANDSCVPPGDAAVHSCLRLIQGTSLGGLSQVLENVDVAMGGTDLYDPSTTLDGFANAYVGFTASSSSLFPSAMTVGALNQPGLVLTAPIVVGAGSGVANNCAPGCQQSPDNNLWGDYSAAAPDPSNLNHAWVAAEVAGSSGNPWDWATQISEMSFFTQPSPTPTASATAIPTNTNAPTPSATATPSWTTSPTTTASPTDLPADTPTETPTVADTSTATPTDSPTPTDTETPTDSPTNTATSTDSPTDTPSLTPTSSETPTDSPTSTVTDSATASETVTASPTQVTNDSETPTTTSTLTPSTTPSDTITASATPTATETFSPTSTDFPTDTATDSPTDSPTPTGTW
jgi:hypothetical protein